MEHFSEFLRGDAHEHRQDPVRSAHGLCHGLLSADRRPVWRRSPGPDAFLRRAKQHLAHIETCLSVHASKLYHMLPPSGMPTKGATGVSMRRWSGSSGIELGLDLTNIRPGLEIALCLSVGRTLKMHIDLRGNIPSFIHISDGKDDVLRYALAGSRHLRRGSWLRDFARRTKRVPRNNSGLFGADGLRIICDQPTASTPVRITPTAAHPLKDPESSSSPTTSRFLRALQKPWQVELFFKWIKQHLRIKQFYGPA